MGQFRRERQSRRFESYGSPLVAARIHASPHRLFKILPFSLLAFLKCGFLRFLHVIKHGHKHEISRMAKLHGGLYRWKYR
jgi:hypothetical protein